MNKRVELKMTKEMYEALKSLALKQGFSSIATYIRFLIFTALEGDKRDRQSSK
jgi:predicted DNA-binding protein